jgi:hypothetical protein
MITDPGKYDWPTFPDPVHEYQEDEAPCQDNREDEQEYPTDTKRPKSR